MIKILLTVLVIYLVFRVVDGKNFMMIRRGGQAPQKRGKARDDDYIDYEEVK